MPLVVYTAIAGDNGDALRHPLCDQPGVRLVCFTDRPVPDPGPWEVRPLAWAGPTPRRTARWHKVNSHRLFPGAEAAVWADGSMQLRVPAARLVADGLSGHNVLASFKHPDRDCVYAEHVACRRLRKDDPALMQRQIDHYKYAGYPPRNGLAETGCVVRVPAACEAFEAEWWATLARFSHRDQLSFDFAAWRLKLPYARLEGSALRSPYFVFHAHRRGRSAHDRRVRPVRPVGDDRRGRPAR